MFSILRMNVVRLSSQQLNPCFVYLLLCRLVLLLLNAAFPLCACQKTNYTALIKYQIFSLLIVTL